LQFFDDRTLIHPRDLPFDVGQMPDFFTKFRQQIESALVVRPCFAKPKVLPPFLKKIGCGCIPDFKTLGLKEELPDPRGVLDFIIGEIYGLKRVKHYIWEQKHHLKKHRYMYT
jgi:deoxyribodipyrimidine photo-lyase